MAGSTTDWVAEKLVGPDHQFEIVDRTPEGYMVVRAKNGTTLTVAVLGVKGVVQITDVEPLFSTPNKPDIVINVPSRTLWSGAAIDKVHASSAAFGSLGDVSRAAYSDDAGAYREKDMGFFINAMLQHTNVESVSYVFDCVFKVNRRRGSSLIVAVINAYNMSAEDVRNAKARIGAFDIVVKGSSYGSITNQAQEAAKSMEAEALKFGELMARLGK